MEVPLYEHIIYVLALIAAGWACLVCFLSYRLTNTPWSWGTIFLGFFFLFFIRLVILMQYDVVLEHTRTLTAINTILLATGVTVYWLSLRRMYTTSRLERRRRVQEVLKERRKRESASRPSTDTKDEPEQKKER